MRSGSIALLLTVSLVAPRNVGAQSREFDRATYANQRTAEVIARAQERHARQGLALAGYRAKVVSQVEGRVGKSRFGRGLTIFKYKTAARTHWAYPGDVKVDIEGARMSSVPMPGFGKAQLAGFFEEIFGGQVWFIPASIGSEIELLGLPEEAALHPFARAAEIFYTYAITDSTTVSMPERTVRAMSISITPRADVEGLTKLWRSEGSYLRDWDNDEPTYFSGRVWIDADSLDVVRMTGAFLGENLWDDDPDSPELLSLEADIEYSLHQNRFWLPRSQVLRVNWQYKYLPGATMPGEAYVVFSDYELDIVESRVAFNDAERPRYGLNSSSWSCPDAWEFDTHPGYDESACGSSPVAKGDTERDGTRWEVNFPTLDSLDRYEFDDDAGNDPELQENEVLSASIREMASVMSDSPIAASTVRLPEYGWVGFVGDALRYNRVTGPSVGVGHDIRLWPAFTTLRVEGRVSPGDPVVAASAAWRRDAPGGLFEASALRALRDIEPWTNGTGLGNSARAFVLGHDDADYYVAAVGGEISYRPYGGILQDGRTAIALERQESAAAESSLPLSGRFQPNRSITDGDYVRATIEKSWLYGLNGANRFTLGGDALFWDNVSTGRVWAAAQITRRDAKTLTMLRARGGTVTGDDLPQMRYRVGGPKTVRGYTYGTATGRTLWSVQADLEYAVNQWWAPRVFADVGGFDFEENPFVGVGAGVSFVSGWVRLEFAKGVTRGGGFRFDVVVETPVSFSQ